MVYKLNEDMLDPLVDLHKYNFFTIFYLNSFNGNSLKQVFWLTEEWASVAALR